MAIKVYISCVGTRDPYDEIKPIAENCKECPSYKEKRPTEGPILSFFRNVVSHRPELMPHYIYLYPTPGKPGGQPSFTEKNAEKTKKILIEQFGFSDDKIKIRPLEGVTDATNYKELAQEMYKKVKERAKEFDGQEVEYLINTSPGTKQMAEVWHLLADGGFIKGARFLRIVEKRFLPKKKDGTLDESRLIQDDTIEPLLENRLINRAIDSFKNADFKVCSDLLTEIGVNTPLREKACDVVSTIADAYHKWDILLYSEALNLVEKAVTNSQYEGYESIRTLLKQQAESLKKIARKDSKEYTIDLYHNAQRRFAQGNYADSLWRCWAIYEVLLYRELRSVVSKKYRVTIDPDDFNITSAPEPLQDIVNSVFKKFPKKRIDGKLPNRLDKEVIAEMLREINFSGLICTIDSNWDDLKTISGIRGAALHKMEKVTKGNAEDGLSTIKRIIKNTFGQVEIDKYSFSMDIIKEMSQDILPSLFAE